MLLKNYHEFPTVDFSTPTIETPAAGFRFEAILPDQIIGLFPVVCFAKATRSNGQQFAVPRPFYPAQTLTMTYCFQKVCKSRTRELRFLERFWLIEELKCH